MFSQFLFGSVLWIGLAVPEVSADDLANKPQWLRMLSEEEEEQVKDLAQQIDKLVLEGNWEEACKVGQEIVDLRTKRQGAKHWQTINAFWSLDELKQVAKQPLEQQQAYLKLNWMKREAEKLEKENKYKQALPIWQKIVALRTSILAEEHPLTADSYSDIADNFSQLGNYKDALDAYQKALDIRRKRLGEEHKDTATAYNNVGVALVRQGRYPEAQVAQQKALTIRIHVLGVNLAVTCSLALLRRVWLSPWLVTAKCPSRSRMGSTS